MKPARRIATAVAGALAGALALAACDPPASGGPARTMPAIPAALVKHDELPFGDRDLARMTRSTRAALDLLEPRWGKLATSAYAIDREAIPQLRQQLRDGMPAGWQKVDAPLAPERGELIAYASGKSLFGVLVAPPGEGSESPALVLTSEP